MVTETLLTICPFAAADERLLIWLAVKVKLLPAGAYCCTIASPLSATDTTLTDALNGPIVPAAVV